MPQSCAAGGSGLTKTVTVSDVKGVAPGVTEVATLSIWRSALVGTDLTRATRTMSKDSPSWKNLVSSVA